MSAKDATMCAKRVRYSTVSHGIADPLAYDQVIQPALLPELTPRVKVTQKMQLEKQM